MTDAHKSFQLKLSPDAHERLEAAAARVGVSMQVYARDAIEAAAQEDEVLTLAAQALGDHGEAFGLDQVGNQRKITELQSRTRSVA